MAKKTTVSGTEHVEALIAEAAYYKAEQRGFVPGYAMEDWLAAEREIRTALTTPSSRPTKSTGGNGAAKGRTTSRKSTADTKKKKA